MVAIPIHLYAVGIVELGSFPRPFLLVRALQAASGHRRIPVLGQVFGRAGNTVGYFFGVEIGCSAYTQIARSGMDDEGVLQWVFLELQVSLGKRACSRIDKPR